MNPKLSEAFQAGLYRVTEYATGRELDIIATNGSEAIMRFVAAVYNLTDTEA